MYKTAHEKSAASFMDAIRQMGQRFSAGQGGAGGAGNTWGYGGAARVVKPGAAGGAGAGAAAASMGGALLRKSPALLASYGVYKMVSKLHNDTVRKAIIQDLMDTDPVIKEVDRDKVLGWYETIYRVAPDLSKEKDLVRELLRNFATFGNVDLRTIKELADTQKSLNATHDTWSTLSRLI